MGKRERVDEAETMHGPALMAQRSRARIAEAATILIADDDNAVRHALRSVFTEDGFSVIEVSTGAEALDALGDAADGRGRVPDALILDVCMPEFSGLGILSAMKRIGFVVPTIVVTGFPDRSVEVLARNFGAVRVIRKPLDLEVVREAVLAAILKHLRPHSR
jgi:DNA-binding response OmpR family regulator